MLAGGLGLSLGLRRGNAASTLTCYEVWMCQDDRQAR